MRLNYRNNDYVGAKKVGVGYGSWLNSIADVHQVNQMHDKAMLNCENLINDLIIFWYAQLIEFVNSN